jgi:hypothetical protein
MESTQKASTAHPSSGGVLDLEGEVYLEAPIDEGFSLGRKWVIWEQYENPPNQSRAAPTEQDWHSSMQKVGWFKDIVTFWQIWSTLPVSHLERFFFDQSE